MGLRFTPKGLVLAWCLNHVGDGSRDALLTKLSKHNAPEDVAKCGDAFDALVRADCIRIDDNGQITAASAAPIGASPTT